MISGFKEIHRSEMAQQAPAGSTHAAQVVCILILLTEPEIVFSFWLRLLLTGVNEILANLQVGNAFVHQYYHILHQSPELVFRFYQDISKLGRLEENGIMGVTTTMEVRYLCNLFLSFLGVFVSFSDLCKLFLVLFRAIWRNKQLK